MEHFSASSGQVRHFISGFLLRVPRPVHGASIRILSKLLGEGLPRFLSGISNLCVHNGGIEPACVFAQGVDFFLADVEGQNAPAILHERRQMGSFPPHAGADIKDVFPRFRGNEAGNQLRSLVLKLNPP